jgi:hypothetical protein
MKNDIGIVMEFCITWAREKWREMERSREK